MRLQKNYVLQLRFSCLVIAALMLAAPFAFAAPAVDDDKPDCHAASIVGAWTATVYRDDGTVERDAQLSFTSDGRLVTLGAIGEGDGTWQSEGGHRFSYTTRTNTSFGYLVVSATVTLHGGRFVGEGGGTAYDAQGNLLGTGKSLIVAVRAGDAEDQR